MHLLISIKLENANNMKTSICFKDFSNRCVLFLVKSYALTIC